MRERGERTQLNKTSGALTGVRRDQTGCEGEREGAGAEKKRKQARGVQEWSGQNKK